jgi:cell division transport system ATP-binding protein
MRILLQINKTGTTVLMATHNYNIIHKFPEKVIMCQGGKLVTSADKLD